MKAMMKGYAIIMNNSVAKGLNETYSHDKLREDNSVYSKEYASSGKRYNQGKGCSSDMVSQINIIRLCVCVSCLSWKVVQ
jgi:hypothetical protein